MSLVKTSTLTLCLRHPKHLFTSQFLMRAQVRGQMTSSDKAISGSAEASSEWDKARPFEQMPSQGAFEIIRAHMPGGKYYKKDTTEMLMLMNKEYGDVVHFPGLFGKQPVVIIFNPNDFETVFRNEGVWPVRLGAEPLDYHRKKHRADFFKGVEGLITTQGEPWGKFRSTVNPVLMQPKTVRLYLKKMSQVNQEFIERIRKLRDPKTQEMPADFERVINRWALESVAIVALDKQLGLLKNEHIDPIMKKFFESVNVFITLSGELDTKPSLWKIVPTPNFRRVMGSLDNILETTSFYINETVERLDQERKSGIEKPENEKSVLEKLLKIDPQIAVVMAMDMLMAGVDTTSGALVGVLLCLAKNPEKQEKLREEVRRILPSKDSEFSEASLNDMSYLRACIKESLRIHPLVFGNGRMVQRDTVLAGYRVPKGTHIGMLTISLNYDEKYYPSPNEYVPERWLRTTKDGETKKCPSSMKSSNPFVYLPFGFGPRSCIGRRIAELELELAIARIVRNFSVAYNYPAEKPFKTVFINVPNIPLTFQMTELDS